ncbi:MAG: cytochrome C [Deltaproteobacteria bacterium]|nr:MAG: cytochrome C [Deltaproteobacteria bacterium]
MKRLFLLLALTGAVLLMTTAGFAAEFNHGSHVDEYVTDGECSTCHVAGANSIVPEATVCQKCHEAADIENFTYGNTKTHGPLWSLNHRMDARTEMETCLKCHAEDPDNLCQECHGAGFADEMGEPGNNMVNVHRSEFRVSHPIAARTDPQACTGCHEQSFCVDCHDDFQPEDLSVLSHRKGWSLINAGGADHENMPPDSCGGCHPGSVLTSHEWSGAHAREARKNLATCQSCHPEGDVCLNCHSARTGLGINPHPADWDDISGNLRDASDGKTCRKCH